MNFSINLDFSFPTLKKWYSLAWNLKRQSPRAPCDYPSDFRNQQASNLDLNLWDTDLHEDYKISPRINLSTAPFPFQCHSGRTTVCCLIWVTWRHQMQEDVRTPCFPQECTLLFHGQVTALGNPSPLNTLIFIHTSSVWASQAPKSSSWLLHLMFSLASSVHVFLFKIMLLVQENRDHYFSLKQNKKAKHYNQVVRTNLNHLLCYLWKAAAGRGAVHRYLSPCFLTPPPVSLQSVITAGNGKEKDLAKHKHQHMSFPSTTLKVSY